MALVKILSGDYVSDLSQKFNDNVDFLNALGLGGVGTPFTGWTGGTGSQSVRGSGGSAQANGNFAIAHGVGAQANGTGSITLGGASNVNSGTWSAIIGGNNNTIPSGKSNVFILAGAGVTATSGNTTYVEDLKFSPDRGIHFTSSSNNYFGTATLSSGLATVNTSAARPNSLIFITNVDVNGGAAVIYVQNRTNGSFEIASLNAGDSSEIAWMIVNPS